MSRTIGERLIAALVVLFLIVYVGYQVARYYRKPISAETVYEYSVSRSINTSGIAIRDEVTLTEQSQGVENYLYEDGSRVSVGDTVAEFYRSSQGDRDIKRARELDQEIQMLREAQDNSVNHFGNTEIYNRDIKEQLVNLTSMSSAGRYQDVGTLRTTLTSLISKKQIATGKETGYDSRIGVLESELEGLQRSSAGELITAVAAPESGYFSRETDGYEDLLSSRIFASYTIDDYLGLLSSNPPKKTSAGQAGKMVLSQNWYLVVAAPVNDVDWIWEGQAVEMQFEQVDEAVPATVMQIVEEKEREESVLILKCNRITDELINLRSGRVELHFQRFTGLRINASDIRFVDNRMGVFVLDDHTVKFRLVDPIYEEQGFLLSRMNYTETGDSQYVRLFDQVITKGTDLHDGKVIQNY